MNITDFTGLRLDPIDEKDYKFGANSPIIAKEVNLTGDWSQYVPIGEFQQIGFETFNCTAFGYTNVIETWINFYIKTGTIKPEFLAFLKQYDYFDKNGNINLSDRALGSMAGTSSEGNSLKTVAETARTKGLAPDSAWPFAGKNLDEYYQTPTKKVFEIAKRMLDFVEFPYEWLSNDTPGVAGLKLGLKCCPMYSALITCPNWFGSPVKWCKATGANHCIELVKQDLITNPVIFDSYKTNNSNSFLRELSLDYAIPYNMRVFVVQKENPMVVYKKKSNPTLYFRCGDVLMGFATTYEAFKKDFEKATIVELDNLNAFKISELKVKI